MRENHKDFVFMSLLFDTSFVLLGYDVDVNNNNSNNIDITNKDNFINNNNNIVRHVRALIQKRSNDSLVLEK